jgi:hypothetical protein
MADADSCDGGGRLFPRIGSGAADTAKMSALSSKMLKPDPPPPPSRLAAAVDDDDDDDDDAAPGAIPIIGAADDDDDDDAADARLAGIRDLVGAASAIVTPDEAPRFGCGFIAMLASPPGALMHTPTSQNSSTRHTSLDTCDSSPHHL